MKSAEWVGAAEVSLGDRGASAEAYVAFLSVCARAGAGLAELKEARDYLTQTGSR